MTRTARAVATAAAVGLLLAGCGYDITGTPTRTTVAEGPTDETMADGGTVADQDSGAAARPPAPSVDTEVPAELAWELSGLTPPPDAQTVSSVQRPNDQDVRSYLVQATTTPEAAAAVCDQMGGLLPATSTPPTDSELDSFGLDDVPQGELGVCFGSTNGEQLVVQRDVLVATTGDRTTVWLSVYEMPR